MSKKTLQECTASSICFPQVPSWIPATSPVCKITCPLSCKLTPYLDWNHTQSVQHASISVSSLGYIWQASPSDLLARCYKRCGTWMTMTWRNQKLILMHQTTKPQRFPKWLKRVERFSKSKLQTLGFVTPQRAPCFTHLQCRRPPFLMTQKST